MRSVLRSAAVAPVREHVVRSASKTAGSRKNSVSWVVMLSTIRRRSDSGTPFRRRSQSSLREPRRSCSKHRREPGFQQVQLSAPSAMPDSWWMYCWRNA